MKNLVARIRDWFYLKLVYPWEHRTSAHVINHDPIAMADGQIDKVLLTLRNREWRKLTDLIEKGKRNFKGDAP